MDRSIFPLAVSLAILCGMVPGCERPAGPAPGPSAPVPSAHGLGSIDRDQLPLEDQYQELKSLFDSIPPVFRDRPERSIQDLVRDVESGIEAAEEILAEAGDGGGIISFDGSERGEVEFMLAHLLFVSFNRMVSAKKADGIELADRALDLVRSAAIDLAESSPRGAECLLLAGRLYQKRSAYRIEAEARNRDLAAARECFGEFLLARPDGPDRASLGLSIADTYFMEGRYADARAVLETALAASPRPPGAFFLEERLFDALTGCGDLEAMEALVRKRLAEYPDKLDTPVVEEREREAMAVWIDVGQFWLGHVRYALGDIASAGDSFRGQIARVDQQEAALRARGEKIGDVARIFRDLRSRRMVAFLEANQGKRPALDFELGDRWATAGRTTLEACRGKVVAALFRNPGDQRSADFLRAIDRLWRKRRDQGLEAIAIGFLTVTPTAEEQVQAMREEMAKLAVGIPAGFDPQTPDPPIFRAMGAIVGSPSFLVFDRAGRAAWFLADPRPMDAGIAVRVIERLLAEPGP